VRRGGKDITVGRNRDEDHSQSEGPERRWMHRPMQQHAVLRLTPASRESPMQWPRIHAVVSLRNLRQSEMRHVS
jgi:hypothetical protein